MNRFDRQYSQRLGVLTGAQLQAALDRFDLGRLVEARPASGGLFGQNVLLTTTSGEYVLRGKPHEPSQFPTERFFAEIIHERTTAPGPWPYLVEDSPDIFGWPFVIMPRMPGRPAFEAKGEDGFFATDGSGFPAAMGRALAALHEATWENCGEYSLERGTIEPIEMSYRHWLASNVERRVARGLDEGWLRPDEAAWCRELYEGNAFALDEPFKPALVHHDYKAGNVTVEREDGVWRVSGIFDLMECYFGDGEEDFRRVVFDFGFGHDGVERLRAFVDAYSVIRPLRAGSRERFRINVLRDTLLIWGFEHRNGRCPAPAGTAFRIWAEPYVTLEFR
jgi:aminoglycoside phosphotransferase (APT) family kinase protein